MSRIARTITKSAVLLSILAAISCNPVGDLDLTSPSSAPTTATVDIRSTGFNPTFVVIAPGGVVTFRNRDNVSHQVASDPHPDHAYCPELNGPLLAPGATFVATMPREDHRGCSLHDDQKLDQPEFRGTVWVCRQFALFGCA